MASQSLLHPLEVGIIVISRGIFVTFFLLIRDQIEWVSNEECPTEVTNKHETEQQKLEAPQGNEDLHGLFKIKKFWLEFQTRRAEQAEMEDAWLFPVHSLWLRKVSENLAPWQQWKFLLSALVSKSCALLVPSSFSLPVLVLACHSGE